MNGRFLGTALLLFVALLCAACQTHDTWRPTNSGSDSYWWRGELEDLQREYLAAIAAKCLPVGLDYQKCMKERIAASLSPDGEIDGHCSMDDTLSVYVDCVDLLTTAARAYAAFGFDPQSDMDWSDPQKAISDAAELMIKELLKRCMPSDERTCFAREITYRFAAELSEADRCAALIDQVSQVRCALDLSLMEKYRSALVYVG